MARLTVEITVKIKDHKTEAEDNIEVTAEESVMAYLPFGQMAQETINELLRKMASDTAR